MAKKKTYGQQLTKLMTEEEVTNGDLAVWCRVLPNRVSKWRSDIEAPTSTAQRCVELFFELKKSRTAIWAAFMEDFRK